MSICTRLDSDSTLPVLECSCSLPWNAPLMQISIISLFSLHVAKSSFYKVAELAKCSFLQIACCTLPIIPQTSAAFSGVSCLMPHLIFPTPQVQTNDYTQSHKMSKLCLSKCLFIYFDCLYAAASPPRHALFHACPSSLLQNVNKMYGFSKLL